MTTKLQGQEVKQESLIELVKQAGIDAGVYPHSIVGYEPITFEAWIREMNLNWRVKDEMKDYGRWEVGDIFKLLKKRKVFCFLTENEKKKIVEEITEKRRWKIDGKIDNWPQIVYARRYYLSGTGLKQNPWTLPLSRGILLKLLEAQETKQFCRFEIWEPHRIVDPILIGFSNWQSKWSIGLCEYTRDGRPDGDHFLPQCRVTYKICAWE